MADENLFEKRRARPPGAPDGGMVALDVLFWSAAHTGGPIGERSELVDKVQISFEAV